MKATIIVPFHRNLDHLALVLTAVRQSMQTAEVLIAADGAVDDCQSLAQSAGAVVIPVAGPSGPATARNRAAGVATGDVFVFVDADVVPTADAIPGMCRLIDERADVAAVFGAYDLDPSESNFMSQFKNLSHAYVHEIAAGSVPTFWAGLGAVRASVFREAGGFDERFRRPSIEDIDLGYRITGRGHTVLLDPRFRGKHLKRWTFASSVKTDVWARGVPWTQLMHRVGGQRNELNLNASLRLSVVCAYLVLLSLAGALVSRWALAGVVLSVTLLVRLNLPYYRWLSTQRGAWFGVRGVAAHFVHHLCNGFSFVVGTLLHVAGRVGIRMPGMLPSAHWTGHAQATAELPPSSS